MPSVPASWPRHTTQLHALCSPRLPGPCRSGGVTGKAGLPGNSIKAPQRSRHLSCAPSQGLRGPCPRHREGPVCTRVHGAQGGGLSGGLGQWSWASRGGRFPPHERLAGVSGIRGPGRGSLGFRARDAAHVTRGPSAPRGGLLDQGSAHSGTGQGASIGLWGQCSLSRPQPGPHRPHTESKVQ